MEVNNALGRRKTAVARVYMSAGTGNIFINGKDIKIYFPTILQQHAALKPFEITGTSGQFDVKIHVDGGGSSGQAEAVQLGIARALVKYNPEFRAVLKVQSLLTRDPRMVERK